jgi:UrcA family protein
MVSRLHRATAAVLAGVTASAMIISTPVAAQVAQDDEIVIQGIPVTAKVVRVSYRDLNLRYIAHLNTLNDRVERAVRDVCELADVRDTLDAAYRRCAEASWARARPEIHRAYLRANRLAYQ